MKERITFISDMHGMYKDLPLDEIEGTLIVAGDFSNVGYPHEIQEFCEWFDALKYYDNKIFIAGNHDRGFEDNPKSAMQIVNSFKNIEYLQDDLLLIGDDYEDMIKVWGTPHQPEFCNWAFNLPRSGAELEHVWSLIPKDIDILVTHGPPQGIMDTSGPPWSKADLGCELLLKRVKEIKPKIHVFGHVHGGRGIEFIDGTLFINASVVNEKYQIVNKPIVIDFDFATGEYEIIYL
jgi:Icc-related predicted phosphoesterase